MSISGIGKLTTDIVLEAVNKLGTPCYLYDENVILQKCIEITNMPNAYGLIVNYSIKANSNKSLLQLLRKQGLGFDISSLNEGRRAYLAGIPYNKMMLTTQEIPLGKDRKDLESMIMAGMKYNVCSLRQLYLIADFASHNSIPLSIRIHPGVGSGESSTRNTGNKYACFGIHLADIDEALSFSKSKKNLYDQIHVHIGSGGDPEQWRANIDRELGFVKKYFPDVNIVNLGGGFKEARMPDEIPANIEDLGFYAKMKFENFFKKTGRKLTMTVEPGTFIVANSGYIITSVIDKKRTGPDGFDFVILDGGMEVNARPLFYGSRHPIYVVSKEGDILSTEIDLGRSDHEKDLHVVGKCCESGDSQSLNNQGKLIPRTMADPQVGDYVIIGGVGAYCSTMSPFNYNSHTQAPELLLRENGTLVTIRERQSLEQIIVNERSLD
jgi:diaminopimelate decarboxylase